MKERAQGESDDPAYANALEEAVTERRDMHQRKLDSIDAAEQEFAEMGLPPEVTAAFADLMKVERAKVGRVVLQDVIALKKVPLK
jgi:hypothetical protein